MSKHFIRSIFRSLISVLLAGMFFSSAIFSFALTIPSGVEIIEDNAFEGNSSLVEVTIPDSVRVLGSSVFEDCESLETVDMRGHVDDLGYDVFEGCEKLDSVYVTRDSGYERILYRLKGEGKGSCIKAVGGKQEGFVTRLINRII